MNKMNEVKRGEIWLVNLNEEGGKSSLQHGRRPFLIVANEEGCIKYSPILTGVALTSNLEKAMQKKMPTHVFIDKKFGLVTDSIAICEQPRSISRNQLNFKFGEIDNETMILIEKALMIQFGIKYNNVNKNQIIKTNVNIDMDRAKNLLISINQLDKLSKKSKEPIMAMNILITEFIEYCKKCNKNHKEIANKIKIMLAKELLSWNLHTYSLLF